ncbi:MAG: TauD/TfdA family dioxygenase [Alphaproteobacteria bacterium]|nr:TauD/TfdA family dioxygenase [Alphaproteobacteria bacterium]
MGLQIWRLDAALGATVSNIDLSRPLDAGAVAAVRAAWLEHIVLVFPDQDLTDRQLLDFTRYFGELEFPPSKLLNYSQGSGQKADIPLEINVISNVIEDGKKIGQLGASEAKWHTDTPFVERPPSASVLHALEIPPHGGNTSFMNMYAVLEGLPPPLRARIEGRYCKHDVSHTSDGVLRHDYDESKDASECPGPLHPLIRTHPETGREALYLGKRAWAFIEGLPLAESEAVLDEIWDIATRPEFLYEHVWTQGDIVMWDNRCAMHRREAFDASARRIMHRSQLQGDVPA